MQTIGAADVQWRWACPWLPCHAAGSAGIDALVFARRGADDAQPGGARAWGGVPGRGLRWLYPRSSAPGRWRLSACPGEGAPEQQPEHCWPRNCRLLRCGPTFPGPPAVASRHDAPPADRIARRGDTQRVGLRALIGPTLTDVHDGA